MINPGSAPILPRPARAAAALALVAAAAAPLAAQSDRALFAWNGRVDHEVLLVMRGRGVETRYSSGEDRGRLQVGSALPRTDGVVGVRLARGRGAADVVQQPSARNDYTAIVRLRDDQAGAGDYQITTFWEPTNGGYAGDYDRDDRADRGDRRNRGRGWGWGRGGRPRDDDDRRGRDDRDDRDDRGAYGGILGRVGNGGATGTVRWSGRVDDVQEIRIRGRRVSAYTVSGGGATDVRTNVSGRGLPADPVTVRVRTYDGRGSVRVVEQPSARNDYTAVLRIEDRRGGAGFYDVEASWY